MTAMLRPSSRSAAVDRRMQPRPIICHDRAARDRRSIHPYNHTIAPMNPNTPSHGLRAKFSGTIAIGASFEKPTIKPALITPHILSPTINPDATKVPNRSERPGLGIVRARASYQYERIEPTTTANVADIGR